MDRYNIEAVVGLGNPGKEYSDTFHNAGFLAVQGFVGHDVKWRGWKGLAMAVWNKPVLFLPQTFMNLSGKAVKALADFKKLNL